MEAVVAEKVVGRAVDGLIDSVWRQIGYVWNYNSYMEDLQKQLKKLEAERDGVLHQVREVRSNGLEIEESVKNWLESAEEAIKAADEILQGKEGSCFMGCNPNWKTRYNFSRKAKKEMLPKFANVRQEKKFDRIGYRIATQDLEFRKDYEVIESRTVVMGKIVEALKDVGGSMIGLYGLGGVGKSTLLKQLTHQVKKDGLFKVVATAIVTHTPDRKEIQKQLAEWLDFTFDVDSLDVRATKLRSRLLQEEKILVILDDIWAEHLIKLEDIGIPYGVDHKGCKVLISSRNQDVLLQMKVKEGFSFCLQALADNEARSLFEKTIGTLEDPDQIQPLLVEVAEKCGGLPLLIETVATALRGKKFHEWKDALGDLESFDDKGIEGRVHKALMLSFKFLNDDQKSLFLLCSQLLPHWIHTSDLLKYCIGLGLFNQRARNLLTVESVQNRLLTVVSQLKKLCLLLEGDRDDVAKMHDIVHAFAKSVASDQHHVFNGAYGIKLEEWLDDDSFEQCTAISLPQYTIAQLPQVLKCQQLQSFILYNNDPSLKIPQDLFKETKKLRLVDVSGVNLLTLPSSLQFLENLATLCLDRCDLDDISAIGELKNLQVLSLIGSTISRLPIEISELTRLQLLDLSGCDCLELIPQGILNRLTKLEYLLMGNSFVKWQGEGHIGETENVNLVELKDLSNLINLEIQILEAKVLPSNLFNEKLQRFKIFIGNDWGWSRNYEASTTLKLKINKSNQLDNIKVPLKKTEDLYLEDLKGFENVLPELDGHGFPKLKHLHIQNSHETQYIIDWQRMGHVVAFCKLESLSLHNLNAVKKISHGKCTNGCFDNLKKLTVENCHELTHLFSFSLFKCLEQLQEISVRSCPSMKGIVAIANNDDEDNVEWKDETVELTKLCILTLEELPQFSSICSQTATTNKASGEILSVEEYENLTKKKVQFPSLVDLKLTSMDLEWIWSDQMIELSSFAKLTTIVVEGCGKLAYMFTFSMVGGLKHLKSINIRNCNSMQEVITAQGVVQEVQFPKLDFLKLEGLPKLERFVASNFINCPSLRAMWIEDCPQLLEFTEAGRGTSRRERDSTLFDEKASFPSLEIIVIRYMHKLKMIWSEELGSDSFCRLQVVNVEDCRELLKVFPSKQLRRFKNVESLIVERCDSLEDVFDSQMVTKSEEGHGVAASQLRTLSVSYLPKLKQLWNGDSQGFLSFPNLSQVTVRNCQSLRILFPVAIGRNLHRLEQLHITSCGLIKEIITKEENELDSTITFAFPQLEGLTLWVLEQLTSFYNGIHTLDCPQLTKLIIQGCNQLELFGFKHEDEEQLRLKSQFQQPFLPLTMLANLEEIAIRGGDISPLRSGQFPIGFLRKLKAFRVYSFAELPFDLLANFHEMRTLQLAICDLEELFPNDDVGELESTLARILHLQLVHLPRMKHLWKQDSEPFPFLQNLQTLEIWACHSLVSLKGFCASFHNLSVLDLWNCDTLVNVASCSAILGLVSLTTTTIRECQNMTESIATSVDDDKSQFQCDEIIFKKLQTLELHCLVKLTSFCSATCNIKLPSLEQMTVFQCPNMKIFSHGDVTAPKLKRVYVTKKDNKSHWIGDLNTTIKQLYTQMVGFNGLEILKLSEYPQLKQVWLHHHQLPVNFFYNLVDLEIEELAQSSISISANLLPFLNNLKKLVVKNCDSMEQVFGVPSSSGYEFSGYLTNLKQLHLIGLPSLSSIFPSSMWRIVLNLEELMIENCKSVREVFDFQEVRNTDINMTLESQLKVLKLDNLPCLRHIWDEISLGSVMFDKLNDVLVWKCPSLNYIFPATIASNLPQLLLLNIDGCVVEEVVGEVEGVEATPEFVFPQLQIMHLWRSEKLKCLYKGNHTFECPMLKNLNVYQCDSLQIFGLGNEIQPFFSFLQGSQQNQVLQTLEDLEVGSCNSLLHLAPSSASFGNLKTLNVENCNGLVSLLAPSTAKSLVQLTTMEIKECKELRGIIANEGDEAEEEIVFRQLKHLQLNDLPKLSRFCICSLLECPVLQEIQIKDCPQINSFASNSDDISEHALFNEKVMLPMLEKMEIINMDNIEMIWHSSLGTNSFVTLKELKLVNANQLVKIFPSNMYRNLQNLEKLVILDCASVKVVFDYQDLTNADINKIVENQFRELELVNLQNLRHIWNEDTLGSILFDKLNLVKVWKCPTLTNIFPASVASYLPQLTGLSLDECGVEELVAEVEGVEATPRFIFPRLEELYLYRSKKLKCLYKGKCTFECPKLKALIVVECDSLQIFGSGNENQEYKKIQPFFSFLQGSWQNQVLQTLETLFLYACNNLLRLAPSSASFGNLKTLYLVNCNGLVSLLAPCTAKSLLQLTTMEIQECKDLSGIIANEGDEAEEEIVFINLQSLVLAELPSLICFCSEEHNFKFPALKQVTLKECPKMQFFCKGELIMPNLQEVNESECYDGNLNDTIHKLHTEQGVQHPMAG